MIFEVQNGSFGYGKGKNILNDISFTVNQGEVFSILGSNGVGKTTLLKCTLGFQRWRTGRTLIDGVNLTDMTHQEVWTKIGYVPQAKLSAFAYTTDEMVLLGRNAHLGMFAQPDGNDRKIARDCLDMVGISHLSGKLCSKISGGELQMVLIARALAAQPKLLVLDEPESNLDFRNQLVVLDTIRNLAREKDISAIVNTHYPEHAVSISDKALILKRNGSGTVGDAEKVITEEQLRTAFDVDVRIRHFYVDQKRYTCVLPISTRAAGEEQHEFRTDDRAVS